LISPIPPGHTQPRLLKEVTSYEKEASDALKVIEKVKKTEGKDEYDVRQSVRPESSYERE
jgi:hypothetical protein